MGKRGNSNECRLKRYPGRGGTKKCAEALGVSSQQRSPWERGKRTPDESRLRRIAEFFGVTVEFLRRDNRARCIPPEPEQPTQPPPSASDGGSFVFMNPLASSSPSEKQYIIIAVKNFACRYQLAAGILGIVEVTVVGHDHIVAVGGGVISEEFIARRLNGDCRPVGKCNLYRPRRCWCGISVGIR